MKPSRRRSSTLTLGLLFTLATLPPLHAQAPGNVPVDTKPSTTNPAPAGQAPDEVMKKLSDLVHAGKYAEAQQTVAALLILYPDDQRLVKAKVLLDKASVTPGAPSGAPSANPPTRNVASAQPASDLAGMDKVDYDGLIELARQAQQNADFEEQKAALKQFMDQSTSFLQKHPDQMLLWQFSVVSAISLNDPLAGYEAGQKLLAAGAADSNDPALQQLLGQLKNKGWIDKQSAERQAAVARTDWVIGTWSVSWSHIDKSEHVLKTGNEYIDFSRIDSRLEGCIFHGVKPTHFSYCSVRIEALDTGKLQCENLNLKSVWQPLSCETGEQDKTMKMEYLPSKEGDRYSWLLHKQ